MDYRRRPWTRPIDELLGMEHAELHLLVAIGAAVADLMDGQERNVADLTALQAAVDNLGADSTADHDAIIAAFTALGAQITDLTAQIAALVAGQVDQATIDSLTATVVAADAAFDSAAAAVAPVVVPVEPPVV